MLSQDRITEISYAAWTNACCTKYPIGSQMWMTSFSGHVKDLIDQDFKDIKYHANELAKKLDVTGD